MQLPEQFQSRLVVTGSVQLILEFLLYRLNPAFRVMIQKLTEPVFAVAFRATDSLKFQRGFEKLTVVDPASQAVECWRPLFRL